MRKFISVLLLASLAGCAGTPVSQGGKAEIVSAGSDTIRIRWNPQLTNERDMRSKAIAFCGGRDVDLLATTREAGAADGMQVTTWRCDSFPGTGPGM